jgi:phosphatidylserine synthase
MKFKYKNVICFCGLFLINSVFGILFYEFNLDKVEKGDFLKVVFLWMGSLVLYWGMNLFYYISFKMKNETNSVLGRIFAILISLIAIIVFFFNLKGKPILYLPLMYLFSIISSSILWEFFNKKKDL